MTHEFGCTLQMGDFVSYLGCNPEQVAWGNNDDPNGILIQGEVYTVDHVEVHSQHTKIRLVGYTGSYNSVCFERYPL